MSQSPKTETLWQDELRKLGGTQLIDLLTEIRDSQCHMKKRIDSIEGNIEAAIKQHTETAFAGGDADGHRRAHEAMIAMIEEKRKLRVAIQEKTISGLAWAAMIFIGLAIWGKIKQELGIPQ